MARQKQHVVHVQIKFPHTGFRLATQFRGTDLKRLMKKAEKEAEEWKQPHLGIEEVRVLQVKRKTKGLAQIRRGKVVGWS